MSIHLKNGLLIWRQAMVLYNSEALISFPRYGIGIPSLDSRKSKTIQSLLDHPRLGPLADRWYLRDIPALINRDDLERAHTPSYIASLFGPGLEKALIKAYELIDETGSYNRYDPDGAEKPLSGLLDDVQRIISGTYIGIKEALDSGFCYYLGGGMHHAHPGFGHGFCLLNDICIALLKARNEGLFRTAWVIDMDAHRGDGTAEIMADRKDITTLSIHMASGWPLDSPAILPDGSSNPSWFPGDVDIPIESGEEEFYIPRLMDALKGLEGAGLPDLAFVVGGVDPYEKDELASTALLQLTKEQMLERDQSVYNFLAGRKIPQVWVSAGGYGESSWEIHSRFLQWVLEERLNP